MTDHHYLNWRKSSFSTDGSGCVQVSKDRPGFVAVRDSKLGENSPVLEFNEHEWAKFKQGIANNEF